jgi:hypothetical protein
MSLLIDLYCTRYYFFGKIENLHSGFSGLIRLGEELFLIRAATGMSVK